MQGNRKKRISPLGGIGMNNFEIKSRLENGIVHFEIYRDGVFQWSEDTLEEALRSIKVHDGHHKK